MRHQHRVSHALWSFELLRHPCLVLDCSNPQTVGHQDFSGENFLPEFHSGVIWTWTFCLTVRLFASILAPLCTNGLFCPALWWPVHKSLASPTTRQNTSSHKFWFHFLPWQVQISVTDCVTLIFGHIYTRCKFKGWYTYRQKAVFISFK